MKTAIAALVLITAAPLHAQEDPAALIARIEAGQAPVRGGLDQSNIQELMQRLRVPGVSIAVIKDFKVHWAKGYGLADVETQRPVDSWKVPATPQPVTPRALLSHSSGADDGFGFPGYDPNTPMPTLPQIMEGARPSNVGAVRFGRPMFQGYKYSGGAVTLMQMAVMDLTGANRSPSTCEPRCSSRSA